MTRATNRADLTWFVSFRNNTLSYDTKPNCGFVTIEPWIVVHNAGICVLGQGQGNEVEFDRVRRSRTNTGHSDAAIR